MAKTFEVSLLKGATTVKRGRCKTEKEVGDFIIAWEKAGLLTPEHSLHLKEMDGVRMRRKDIRIADIRDAFNILYVVAEWIKDGRPASEQGIQIHIVDLRDGLSPEMMDTFRDLFLKGVQEPESVLSVGEHIHREIEQLQASSDKYVHLHAEGYEHLAAVFGDAFDQAARGKGAERHANMLSFDYQRMQTICTLLGSPEGMEYQVIKKMTEAMDMADPARRRKELLGAINYLAGIVVWLDNMGKDTDGCTDV